MTVKDFCAMWSYPVWYARQMVQVMDMCGREVGRFDRWDIRQGNTPEARDIAQKTVNSFVFKDGPKHTTGAPKQTVLLYCDL